MTKPATAHEAQNPESIPSMIANAKNVIIMPNKGNMHTFYKEFNAIRQADQAENYQSHSQDVALYTSTLAGIACFSFMPVIGSFVASVVFVVASMNFIGYDAVWPFKPKSGKPVDNKKISTINKTKIFTKQKPKTITPANGLSVKQAAERQRMKSLLAEAALHLPNIADNKK